MKLHIEIGLDGAAMVDDCAYELRQMMERIITAMERSPEPRIEEPVKLRDTNGNTVGKVWTTGD